MTKGMAVCASSFDFIWFLYTPQTVDRLREPSPLSLMLKRDTTQGQTVWKSLPFHFDKTDIVPGSLGAKTLCLKYSCSLHGGQYHLNIFWNVFGCEQPVSHSNKSYCPPKNFFKCFLWDVFFVFQFGWFGLSREQGSVKICFAGSVQCKH